MKDILTQAKRNDGMTVPDGYFADFAARMTAALPERDWEKGPVVVKRSAWHKVRPYVYLAAMFAGVWCMMQMFTLMGAGSRGFSVDGNPVLSAAISNDHFINDYFINEGEISDYQLMQDLYETGLSPDDCMDCLENDSDYVHEIPLEPEFPIADEDIDAPDDHNTPNVI